MEEQMLVGEKNLFKSIGFPLLSLVFLTWAWKIFTWVWLNPKRKERMLRKQGFKGNPYTFMRLLFGDIKENSKVYAEALGKTINIHDAAAPRVMPFVHKTIEKYGKMAYMWVGPRPRVLILDPELMKTVMVKHNNYIKNFKVTNHIVQTLVTGVLSFEGKVWSQSRTKLTPVFQLEKLKQMLPTFQSSCDELLSEWKNLASNEDRSCLVDVFPHLVTLTSKVVSRSLFASDYSKDKNMYELLKEMACLAGQTTRIMDMPGAKYLPNATNRRTNEISRKVRERLVTLINERSKAIKSGQPVEDNFFNAMLNSELAEAHGIRDMDDVVGQAKLFYFAGFESTATMLVWAMILLGINQDWQEKARKEVFQVFGKDRKPDYEGLGQLKIISMILNETLRLYPPIVELSRLVEEETKLGDYTIPADTLLMLPVVFLHRDPEIWGEDADEFKPDRFAEGVLKATNGRPAFFPFGWGGRVCIGQNHALLEGKLVLANILRQFTFELAPTYAHAPYVVFTVQPQYGAPLVLRKIE